VTRTLHLQPWLRSPPSNPNRPRSGAIDVGAIEDSRLCKAVNLPQRRAEEGSLLLRFLACRPLGARHHQREHDARDPQADHLSQVFRLAPTSAAGLMSASASRAATSASRPRPRASFCSFTTGSSVAPGRRSARFYQSAIRTPNRGVIHRAGGSRVSCTHLTWTWARGGLGP